MLRLYINIIFLLICNLGVDDAREDARFGTMGRSLLQSNFSDEEVISLRSSQCDPTLGNPDCGLSLQEQCVDFLPSNTDVDCSDYVKFDMCEEIDEGFCRASCGRCAEVCKDVLLPFTKDCNKIVNGNNCDDTGIKGIYCQKSCGYCQVDTPFANSTLSPTPPLPPPPAPSAPLPFVNHIEFGTVKWSDILRNNHDIIYLKDVNRDGKDDFVAFGEDGVLVALSNGTQFLKPELWTSQFGSSEEAGGWVPIKNHRYLEDLNGDGLVDIIGFLDGTYVGLNTGSSFQPMQLWTHDFGNSLEWNNETEFPHFLVDMNNDGLKDLVGFNVDHVWVSLSNGSAFQTAKNWIGDFGTKQGYKKHIYPVHLADVNGDDLPDIVAFAANGTEVAFSTGQNFQPKQLLLDGFAEKQGWKTSMHFRFVEDLNNDGLADILANGHNGVYVALSNGGEGFSLKKVLEDSYGYYTGGWRVDKNPIVLYDVNGDSLPDIVGFGDSNVYISYNKGGGEFEKPEAVSNSFGVSKPGEWSIHDRRFVGDINGDGLADLVGISGNGIFVSTSSLK